MKIKDHGLVFAGLKKRGSTKRIIIHHSAGPDVPVTEIHLWHLKKGWSGVGYHFVIRADGSIEQGRPLEAVGAHAGAGGNPDSIGVCLTGDFTKTSPGARQFNALVLLIDYLRETYNRKLDVIGHKDVMATACPGACFPWEQLHSRLGGKEVNTVPDLEKWKMEMMEKARQEGLIAADHMPDEPAPKWFVLTTVLNLLERLEAERHEG